VQIEIGQRRLRLISDFERNRHNGRLQLLQRRFVPAYEKEISP
jgi:hypothetical protein